MKNYLKENHFTKFEKDHTYNVIYTDKNGEQKEGYFTPTKDTSIAGMIEGFRNENSDFFKLVEITESKKVVEDYEPLPSDVQFDIYELIMSGKMENQLKEENIKYTFDEIKEEYPELSDKLSDIKNYTELKANEIYEDNLKESEDLDLPEAIDVSELKDIATKILPKKDIETHESDLYIRKTPKSTELLNKLKNKNSGLLSTFKDNIDGDMWYDIPFGNLSDNVKNESQQKEIFNSEGIEGFINKINEYNDDVIAEAFAHYDRLGKIDKDTIIDILNMCRETNGESMLTEKSKQHGIFDKKDVKSFIGDINREVGLDFIKSLDNNIDIELPTKGSLLSNDSIIQYTFKVINSKGADLVSIGEQIANKMKNFFGESGKIKDVKCVPEHTSNNKQVLTLSIIGPDIVKVQESILTEDEENPEKVKQDVEDAVENAPEDESSIAPEVIFGNIDVLIADEVAAIDGYKGFLNQLQASMSPALYDIIEKEVDEIIQDEEDHIEKLKAIQEGLSFYNE